MGGGFLTPRSVGVAGKPVQRCDGGQFARRAGELLGVVHLGREDPYAQLLRRVDRLHALARGGFDRHALPPGAFRRVHRLGAARYAAARYLALFELRSSQNASSVAGRSP